MAGCRAIAWLLGLVLTAQACELDNDVGQSGEYVFLPGATGVDSTPYPLRHLLIVEDDADSGRTFVYFFSGELGAAGLGIADLRRLALHYGRFQMAFEVPRVLYADEPIEAHGLPRRLRLGDDTEVELAALDDTGLARSGAARFLRSVSSDDYRVGAFFGVFDRSPELPPLSVAVEGGEVALQPTLSTPDLAVEVMDDALLLEYGEAEGADSIAIDLVQEITNTEDDRVLEAMVRTSLPPGAMYGAGAPLLTDVAGQGCFDLDRPLRIRLTQVAREYTPGTNGDSAVIHSKFDSLLVEAETWRALVDDPQRAAYCEDYE